MGGDAGPLGADRLLGDLHQQFLPLLQQLLDRVQRVRHRLLPLLPLHEGLVLLHGVEDVRDVEKGGLFQTDIHEGGLHPRQHPHHPTLVDVPDDPLDPAPLDVQLRNGAVFDERDAGFVGGGIYDQLVPHCDSPHPLRSGLYLPVIFAADWLTLAPIRVGIILSIFIKSCMLMLSVIADHTAKALSIIT